ncbi:protein ABHD8-like [Watersipora subatra]|uniref:protein ABHD8-like n=1 Tax=Watersipora subatra TaxID=2589382 RepID=UPI00355B1110
MGNSSTKIAPDQSMKCFTTSRGINLAIKSIEPCVTNPTPSDPASQAVEANSEKSKAIFFIHGVAGSSHVWESQLNYFTAQGYYAIALDLLGHGKSETPDKQSLYKFMHMSTDCVDVFDNYCKDFNTVVAHSYGTSLATFLARQRPSKIQKLVLMSGGAPVPLAPQTSVLSLPTPCLTLLKPVLTRFFQRSAFHKKNRNLPNKDVAFNVPVHVLRHTMKGQVWEEGDENFHRWLAQPTLLLHGEDDRLEPFAGTMEMHHILQKSEIYCIPHAGHMIMMEHPSMVNVLIEKFLNSDHVTSNQNISTDDTVTQKVSSSHTHVTKSQPNLRRNTIST